MARQLVIPTNVVKEPVVCPQCFQKFGQTVGDLFRSRPVDHQYIVIGDPALIHCGICGGVWLNPSWSFHDSPDVVLRQIDALPYSETPPRNWAAVPSRLRPVALREIG